MFALVDCNNFYASCERAFNPMLVGKPIVVLSNNDGCVIARSQEAKDLGIPMGAPAHQILQVVKDNKVSVYSSNYALYGDMSARVMTILSQFSHEIEVYSIDEAFISFHGFNLINLEKHGMKLKETVYSNTGIPVSIGIGKTKTLAKLANKIAKRGPGAYSIDTEVKRIQALNDTPIGDIWGIGRQSAKKLNEYGVNSAMQFIQQPDTWVKEKLSIVGLRLKYELQGISALGMMLKEPDKQAIATTRSFPKTISQYDLLAEAVANHAASCAAKVRKQRSCAGSIQVFVHTSRFRPDLPSYANKREVKLPVHTCSSSEFIEYATIALRSIFRPGFEYKKVGVIVSDLVPSNQVIGGLFDTSDRAKAKRAMLAMDGLNSKYGKNKVKIASQGFTKGWQMNQQQLSPCYTTRWQDLLKIV
ncbi:MAG: Y-family DNA polymerase [Bacteroidota bacterium]|nr:Y-family DNA polymerase [Bacteroidota bacterium]